MQNLFKKIITESKKMIHSDDFRQKHRLGNAIQNSIRIKTNSIKSKTEIIPLEKVIFDGVSVPLGADMSAVEAAIGKGEQVGNRYYHLNTNVAIDYDADNRVEFIEFLAGIDGELHPTIYGVPVFETDADALTEILREKNGDEIDDFENGYSLSFLNISVGLYREATPKSVNEMIDEMKADGIPTDDNEDVAQELRKAHHWTTIGIGVKGYYNREPMR